MKIITIILFLSIALELQTSGQNYHKTILTKIDSANIERADRLANQVLGIKQHETNYLVFSIGNNILFIYDSCKIYKSLYFIEKFNYKKQEKECIEVNKKKVNSKQNILKYSFNAEICSDSFIYTDSILYNNNIYSSSSYIYFCLVKNGGKMCEFNIPLLDSGKNYSEKIILNNKQLFNYLFGELLSRMKNNNKK